MNNYLKFIRNEFPKSVNLGKLNFTEHVFKNDCSITSIQPMKLLPDRKNLQCALVKDRKIEIEKLNLCEGDNNHDKVSYKIIFFPNFNVMVCYFIFIT